MDEGFETVGPCRVLRLTAQGERLGAESDALSLIEAALPRRVDWIAVPADRLHPDFFRLRTGLAGEFAQKLATYRINLAIIGDISEHLDRSSSLRAYVSESNRSPTTWFVDSWQDFTTRLSSGGRDGR